MEFRFSATAPISSARVLGARALRSPAEARDIVASTAPSGRCTSRRATTSRPRARSRTAAGAEHDRRLPALPPHALERVHPHRHDHGAGRAGVAGERDGGEMQPERAVGEGDELPPRRGLVGEVDDPGRRRGLRAREERGGTGGAGRDGERVDRGHRLAVVGEELHERRGGRRRRVLAEVGGDTERHRLGRVEGLGLDRTRDDAALHVGAEAHDDRDDQRRRDAEAGPQRAHVPNDTARRLRGHARAARRTAPTLAAVALLLVSRRVCRLADGTPVGNARAQPRLRGHGGTAGGRSRSAPSPTLPHGDRCSVASYDSADRVLVLKSALGDSRFVVAPEARLWIGSRRVPVERLATSVGVQATVAYSDADGVATTHTVRLARGKVERDR